MARVEVILASAGRERLAAALQEAGLAEVEHLEGGKLEEGGLERSSPLVEVAVVSEYLNRSRKLLDVLDEYDESTPSFLADLLGVDPVEPTLVEEKSYADFMTETGALIESAEKQVGEANARLGDATEAKRRLADRQAKLEPLEGLDVNLAHLADTERLASLVGLIPPEKVEAAVDDVAAEAGDASLIKTVGEFDGKTPMLVTVPAEKRDAVSVALRKHAFSRIDVSGGEHVTEELARAADDISEAELKVAEAGRELASLTAEFRRSLLEAVECLEIERAKCEVFIRAGVTRETTFMAFWVPKAELSGALELVSDATDALSVVEVDEDPEDAPTLLANPGALSAFESLTSMFSVPRYNQLDPTFLLAPSFVLFFGLMLTDAVYGLALIASAIALKRAYGRYSKGLSDLCTVAIYCGVSAVFFGLLTGSILGDLAGKYLLGGAGSQDIALWLDPLEGANAIKFLVAVCSLGLVHLYVGYLAGGIDALKRGKRWEALSQYLAWYVLAFGVILMLTQSTTYGAVIALASVILLVAGAGAMAFMDIIGLVGNTLSYARLLALAMTTAGIALTFNFLASMLVDLPYVGVLAAAIVFVVGHAINFLINSLGSFVHALRLNYIEFFGTFYDGGGTAFTPFKQKRKYTTKRKDKK